MILAPKRQYWSIEKDRPIELEVTVKNQAAEVEGVVVGRVDEWGHWIYTYTYRAECSKNISKKPMEFLDFSKF